MSETDELRSEIAHTRERMSDTLDQLGTKLNPNRIKAEVRDNIREATIGRVENMARQVGDRAVETRDGLLHTIRENPIPAAMIGIGLGWMIFGGRRRHSHDHTSHTGHLHTNEGYYGDVSATTPRLQQDDAAGGIGASISHDNGNGIIDRVKGSVSGVTHRLGDLGDGIGDKAGVVGDRVSTVWDATSGKVSDIGHTLGDAPLALGAVALAAGLAAGLAIPESRREVELMGDTRDRLLGQAREAASDMKDKVRNVAERVVDEAKTNLTETVKDAARSEGLMGSSSNNSSSTGFGSSSSTSTSGNV